VGRGGGEVNVWIRAIFGMLVAINAVALAPSKAQDDSGAWCGREDIGSGVVVEKCHYATFEECRTLGGGVSTTFCTPNPRYVAPRRPIPDASPRNNAPRPR
jgi:hypothetical protein